MKGLFTEVWAGLDASGIPGLGRSPGEENGNPLQHSCLENPMDRGAWQVIVHEVAKRWTRLKHARMVRVKETQEG